MTDHFEIVEHEGNDPRYNMPYVPAIKVHSGKTVYVSGVTAAPVYHSHPHVPAESEPLDSALAGADAVVIATNHSAFEGLLHEIPSSALLVDPWNVTGAGRVFGFAHELIRT